MELLVAYDEVKRPLCLKGRVTLLGTVHENDVKVRVEAALNPE